MPFSPGAAPVGFWLKDGGGSRYWPQNSRFAHSVQFLRRRIAGKRPAGRPAGGHTAAEEGTTAFKEGDTAIKRRKSSYLQRRDIKYW